MSIAIPGAHLATEIGDRNLVGPVTMAPSSAGVVISVPVVLRFINSCERDGYYLSQGSYVSPGTMMFCPPIPVTVVAVILRALDRVRVPPNLARRCRSRILFAGI